MPITLGDKAGHAGPDTGTHTHLPVSEQPVTQIARFLCHARLPADEGYEHPGTCKVVRACSPGHMLPAVCARERERERYRMCERERECV